MLKYTFLRQSIMPKNVQNFRCNRR